MATFNRFMDLPDLARLHILNYVGDNNKQDELINLTVISKAVNKDCQQAGIEWTIFPLFVLSPIQNIKNGGSMNKFFQNLNQYQQHDENTYNKLQSYRLFRVNNIDKFDSCPFRYNMREFVESIIENDFRMEGIRSLNMSLPQSTATTTTTTTMAPTNDSRLPRALLCIMPNLLEIDFSNTSMGANILRNFKAGSCPRLEKVTWNNIDRISKFKMTGFHMGYITNLIEIRMDNSNFIYYDFVMSYLDSHPETFLFHRCGSKVLERVSIQNAKYYPNYYNIDDQPKVIPQNALIKFVRNAAPSTLKWFRSDLTQENIDMLHNERPDIELVN